MEKHSKEFFQTINNMLEESQLIKAANDLG
jgi:hypothetical protein